MNLSELYLKAHTVKISPQDRRIIPQLFFNLDSSTVKPEDVPAGSIAFDVNTGRMYMMGPSNSWLLLQNQIQE